MCQRYTLITTPAILQSTFNASAEEVEKTFTPNINLSKGELGIVITNEQPNKLQYFHFGFTPFWAKKKIMVLNARAEGDQNKSNNLQYQGMKGIIKKPLFRKAIRQQRCLVLANAFITGPTEENLDRPYVVYSQNKTRPFAMAGVWDEWITKDGTPFKSFAIITTVANSLVQKIGHNRSPIILNEGQERRWLRNDLALRDITAMLQPFPAEDYNAYPISPKIKPPENKDTKLLQPIGPQINTAYKYIFYQELRLQGMGESAARRRRKEEEE